MKKFFLGATIALSALGLTTFGLAQPASARDQVRIVGSSTVFPFSIAIAERVSKSAGIAAPVVESTGTGGGFKLFCAGIGPDHPDISNASRRIKQSEFEDCKKNGISMIEVQLGYDGIVLANSREAQPINLTKKQIFLALAAQVPQDGKIVDNPNTMWNEIDPSLPAKKIEVLGPPPQSGTRDAFVELVMQEAAAEFPEIKALEESDPDQYKKISQALREDGAYIEAGENDNLIVQKLIANPDVLGIFGFSFLDQNEDKLQGAIIDGVEPSFENIASSTYKVSRPLYFYVKREHIDQIPGIMDYVKEAVSEQAIGADGYLIDRGLIPLEEKDRATVQKKALEKEALAL